MRGEQTADYRAAEARRVTPHQQELTSMSARRKALVPGLLANALRLLPDAVVVLNLDARWQ